MAAPLRWVVWRVERLDDEVIMWIKRGNESAQIPIRMSPEIALKLAEAIRQKASKHEE